MTNRLMDDRWWREWEAYLRFQSFSDAASAAAQHKTTPIRLRQELLERAARLHLRAIEHREAARKLEPQ